MEMHQVRYFLAVARNLNFTRAAEECNVAQPSLTRAIKQLEGELGGDLFRRERNLTHLSELGQRMLPLMQQCFESAQAAKQVATSLKKGAIAPLPIALSAAINIELILPALKELVRAFPGLALRFSRGANVEVAEILKRGEAEVGIAGPIAGSWERLESWPLFVEPYRLAVGDTHKLAMRDSITAAELSKERMLCRPYCDHLELVMDFLSGAGAQTGLSHNVVSEHDFMILLSAGFGVGVAPQSSIRASSVRLIDIEGLAATRTVFVYGVAGRQRSTAGNTLIKMLRAADWATFEPPAHAVKPDGKGARPARP